MSILDLSIATTGPSVRVEVAGWPDEQRAALVRSLGEIGGVTQVYLLDDGRALSVRYSPDDGGRQVTEAWIVEQVAGRAGRIMAPALEPGAGK